MCSMPLFQLPAGSCQQSLCSLAVVAWLSLPVSFSVFRFPSSYEDTTYQIRAHPNPVLPHLNLFTSAKTLFPDKVTFSDTRSQDLNISFGDTIQPTTGIQLYFSFHIVFLKFMSHYLKVWSCVSFTFNVKLCGKSLTQFST